MAVCIHIERLSKRYGSTVAVQDLSIDIEQGEVFGFLGPNGAGKSTTLYMLTGLVRPSSGRITVFGRDLRKNFLDIAARMGVLAERPAFYGHLTVAKNLLIHSKLAGKEVTLDRVLDLVGMLHVADTKVRELSHGMRQRLGLAQAFLTEPELLILDEPTNGLDVEHTAEVLTLLRRLADEAKVTIVLTSHAMSEVEELCDRVAIMNRGAVIQCDRTDAVISYDMANLEVLIDAPDAAARRLASEDWVEAVETSPGRLHVRLREENPHQLTAFLVSGGFRISGVIPRRRTLREYFLKALNK